MFQWGKQQPGSTEAPTASPAGKLVVNVTVHRGVPGVESTKLRVPLGFDSTVHTLKEEVMRRAGLAEAMRGKVLTPVQCSIRGAYHTPGMCAAGLPILKGDDGAVLFDDGTIPNPRRCVPPLSNERSLPPLAQILSATRCARVRS
jgi:hypothetical protein